MACKTCGGTMIGDGYTLVRHCESVDVSGSCFEPDAGPIYCTMSEEPESTEQNRVWHSGPPPHVGWWNASALGYEDLWRWWNGEHWSLPAREGYRAEGVLECANSWTPTPCIRWNDYWPTNARVPRLAPEDFEVGARWVCVDPAFQWEFRGLEFTVEHVSHKGIVLDSFKGGLIKHFNCLPSTRYVPRRCIRPQSRWDFPMPKEVCRG